MKAQNRDGAIFSSYYSTNYQNTSSAASSMKKYQQLTLAILTITSLVAFLFYKHAYDRLHYTFEYLETFGSVDENNFNLCGNKAYRKINTAPVYWQKLNPNVAIYSAFWDVKNSTLTSLILYKSDHIINVSISSESNIIERTMQCSLKPKKSNRNDVLNIELMKCSTSLQLPKPFLAKYEIGKYASHSIPIQNTEYLKNIGNTSCICVFSTLEFVSSQKLVEFLSYHNSIGIEKFVFYGQLLTPTIRKILDLNGDEMGIFYEEKIFNILPDFPLRVEEYRKVVENDCALRHKNIYENVIALQPNEYIIIKGKPSLNAVIESMPFSQAKMALFIFKFSLMTQYACYEDRDLNKPFLSIDLKVLGSWEDDQISILRPHLMFGGHSNQSIVTEQHIPTTSLAIYNFLSCSSLKITNYDSVTMNSVYSSLIERSLLYRKFMINF